ncbi:transposase [Staphylococcus aureus]|nr:transposase [Staphylococcus aureus]
MCNDTLELLRIKDENINYINQEVVLKMKDKFINMVSVFLVLLYLKLKGITHTST